MKIPFKIRLLLWYLRRQKEMKVYEMTAAQARAASGKLSDRAESFLDYDPVELHHVFDHTIEGRNGAIPIRIYQADTSSQRPLIVFFHGGGFVLRDIDSHDKMCRRIARDNQAVLISVDYRLAPEHKFPAAVYDAYDTVVWAAQHANIHQGDPNKLIVMGDSAGGNLATVSCILSRNLKGPKILHQVLLYPCTDGTMSLPSITKYGEGYFLTKKIMNWFMEQYRSKDEDVYDPLMSPFLADDLSKLPSAFIIAAEYDPLKDDGRLYAKRLKEAGNEVEYKDYGGMIHGFMSMPKLSKKILIAYDDVQKNLSEILSTVNDEIS